MPRPIRRKTTGSVDGTSPRTKRLRDRTGKLTVGATEPRAANTSERPAAGALTDAARYRALVCRDRRFDGKFFIAVRTTKIYCRPVCPAPTARRHNVAFYPCAAAAEAAGFRPCLRCRPESAPGSSAWLGTSSTVLRAFRLIQAGALDDGGVETLAAKLGVGSRHLRRLFVAEIGAPPAAVAQTRRVQTAKRLLDETKLPIARIAHDAGFSSLRRFNETMLATYRRPPSALRREAVLGTAGRSGDTAQRRFDAADRPLVLRLTYREPFAWDELLAFLAARAIPGIEAVDNGCYRRRVRLHRETGIVEIVRDREARCLRVSLPAALSSGVTMLLADVRRVFDLDADPNGIATVLARDSALRRSVRCTPGLRVPGAWDAFEIAVRAIVGQQISVKAAITICGRLVERFGERVAASALPYLFPTPAALACAGARDLDMPRARADALRGLARAVQHGDVALDGSASVEDVTAALQRLPGIGAWTAGYIAMRALGEPDAFPSADLGLRKLFAAGGKKLASARAVQERSEAWRPWRAYATMHAWTTLAAPANPRGLRRGPKEERRATVSR
jgi:AraC family transcriptional regulator of adaptative response / DNA-3-methyladenine glycosylase II